jgi:hypothetical protein
MKIETVRLACQSGWFIQVDGLLTDIPPEATEALAMQAAERKYPYRKITTSEMPEHYSNK